MLDLTPDIIRKLIFQSQSLSNDKCDPDNTCAAILVPLLLKNSEWHLLFTRRTGKVSSHQNEVSFPGGSYEFTDINLENTAIRETYEEIGIEPKDIEILGKLPTSTTITGFKVFPFIALINWPIDFRLNSEEVEVIFSVPISWLMNPSNYYEEDYKSDKFGRRRVIHYKEYMGEHIWGYTAKVVQQFLLLLK